MGPGCRQLPGPEEVPVAGSWGSSLLRQHPHGLQETGWSGGGSGRGFPYLTVTQPLGFRAVTIPTQLFIFLSIPEPPPALLLSLNGTLSTQVVFDISTFLHFIQLITSYHFQGLFHMHDRLSTST